MPKHLEKLAKLYKVNIKSDKNNKKVKKTIDLNSFFT